MSYDDVFFCGDERYSIGVETRSRKNYLSIPMSNGALDYEEYYELTQQEYGEFLEDGQAAIEFAESCRRHDHDELLIEKPGRHRGSPV